jgi:uncharacterized protein YgfB (UPF0149 family)
MKFNKTDTLPEWSYGILNGLVLFESNELGVKGKVLISDWEKFAKEHNVDINSELSMYENLKTICEYFGSKD